jgi:hypothetical protein
MDFMLAMPNWSELHLTPQALQQTMFGQANRLLEGWQG